MFSKSECYSTDINLCDAIHTWSEKAFSVYDFYKRLSIVSDSIILVASMIVLARVIFIFKRKDWFLILTPLFFMCHGMLYVPYDFLTIYNRDADKTRDALEISGFFFYLMGHWTFSAQYLQTALILPKLFIEAKLEWLLQHT